jgi:molybdopterin-guanine dinucleotide biosynthesis protein A
MNSPNLLGAVLAGGQSRRFGSDKALAQLAGHTLLDHALARLERWCGAVVVAGREVPGRRCVGDWPRAGMGPLGGIAAALRLAQSEGFAAVLTIGVDSLALPHDLPQWLTPAPAFVADQPVIGLWPASAADAVAAILAGDGRHSLRALAEAVGARAVVLEAPSVNINTPDDLARLRERD